MGLEDEEIDSLFKEIDANQDNTITYEEFAHTFALANANQIIRRMKRVLFGASLSIENLVQTHCDSKSTRINKIEFKKLVKSVI